MSIIFDNGIKFRFSVMVSIEENQITFIKYILLPLNTTKVWNAIFLQ